MAHTGGMDGHARRRPQHGWTALAIAVGVNLLAWPVLDDVYLRQRPRSRATVVSSEIHDAARADTVTTFATAAAIVLVDRPVPALSLEAILGPEDAARFGSGRVRPRGAELPGARAADRGGGAEGGVATWTDRRDRADDAALRAQLWSSDQAYRAPRADGGRVASSPEAISRRAEVAYGEREPRPRARDGAVVASRGDTIGTGIDGAALPTGPMAEAQAGARGATAAARADGATARSLEAAHVDPGAAAVDVVRDGPARGDRAVAASSDQRRPDPFDLTPPRGGGDHRGEGVAGLTAPGMVADGGRDPGTAASRWGEASDVDRATYATRADPYFVELFRRLDREVVFPHELALELKSGRVVANVILRADGALASVDLHAGSGYAGFDDALVRALRRIGPLGPVPSALLGERPQLRVLIPYVFKSSMIR